MYRKQEEACHSGHYEWPAGTATTFNDHIAQYINVFPLDSRQCSTLIISKGGDQDQDQDLAPVTTLTFLLLGYKLSASVTTPVYPAPTQSWHCQYVDY